MTQEESFLAALQEKPKDLATIYAYCDWLTEQGRLLDAALIRKKNGLSYLYYDWVKKGESQPHPGERKFSTRASAINSLQSYEKYRQPNKNNLDKWLDQYEIVVMEAVPREIHRETAVPKSRREKGKKK